MANPILIEAYLENVVSALAQGQIQQAASLLDHTRELLRWVIPATSSPHFAYSIGLDTGIKRARKPNEDYALATPFVHPIMPSVPGGLFLVADGMGGHANGADASHLAVHSILDFVLPRLVNGSISQETIPSFLAHAIQRANLAVYEQNVARGAQADRAKMGTTISGAIVLGTRLSVANVGDNRTYLFRQGEGLRQITRDHSVVAQMVEDRIINEDEVYSHPQRNQIYRSLGAERQVEVDCFEAMPIVV
jgi:serine/threonine protein phosphatase PrpC